MKLYIIFKQLAFDNCSIVSIFKDEQKANDFLKLKKEEGYHEYFTETCEVIE